MEDETDKNNRVLVPISYDIELLTKKLENWVRNNTSAVNTALSPQALKIKKVTVKSGKKVKLTLKNKLTPADIIWLQSNHIDFSISKYTSKTEADIWIPMIDKKAKKGICLSGTVKAGQKSITLKANKTIKKKTPYYISQLEKKGKKITLKGLKAIRK